ncbi:MAG: glycine--tRNA ligase subunit beta [Candidatus Schekmanbacteria bacterium]|nr:glycine--tRNA ligase subunit beta [Candidatus Schekmanbacteria bacterium]
MSGDTSHLLFEVGTEELPSGYIAPALAALRDAVERGLKRERLQFDRIETLTTPRRLALEIPALAARQVDREEEVLGPPAQVAFREGVPTPAAEGFARKNGVGVETLERVRTDRGEYVGFTRRVEGQSAVALLPAILRDAVLSLTFPKSMRWGEGALRFARPLRWLVCLLDAEIVPVRIADLHAGRETWGHRFFASGPLSLSSAAVYREVLRAANVEPDAGLRRRLLREQAQAHAAAVGGALVTDEELLDIVTHQLELPQTVLGAFDESFLQLPRVVLITCLREHQRYFCVEAPPVDHGAGELMARFVATTGIPDGEDGKIRQGNERVLRARLDDAAFFYREDLKLPLSARVPELDKVLHLAEIGSIGDKTRRIEALCALLCGQLEASDALSPDDAAVAAAAARLCKADLVTAMVNEFASLQGVMGGCYARASGESPAVAAAIAEHYAPRAADDAVPRTLPGALVSFADKLDNIACAFATGNGPSASADPYAVRRQAIALCRIAWAHALHLDLAALVAGALELLAGAKRCPESGSEVVGFIRGRLNGLLGAEAHRYDTIAAVLAIPDTDLLDLRRRVEALTAFRAAAEFDPLSTAFKRVSRILPKGSPATSLMLNRLSQAEEVALHCEVERARPQVAALLAARQFAAALAVLASLRPAVDAFFDHVTVLDENADLAANRLRLLLEVQELFLHVADLREIVID